MSYLTFFSFIPSLYLESGVCFILKQNISIRNSHILNTRGSPIGQYRIMVYGYRLPGLVLFPLP